MDPDPFPDLELRQVAVEATRADDGDLGAGLFQRAGFLPDATIGRYREILDQEQYSLALERRGPRCR
jgi:hypothetical protein